MIPYKVKEIAFDLSMNPVILLVDESEAQVLPIWIGHLEAHSIALALEGTSAPRPLTHDLLQTLCEKVGANITKVSVNDIADGTFYAQLHIKKGDQELIIDARPSDAIALALRSVAPIFVSEKVAEHTLAMDEIFSKEQQAKLHKVLEEHRQSIKKSLH